VSVEAVRCQLESSFETAVKLLIRSISKTGLELVHVSEVAPQHVYVEPISRETWG